MDRLESWKEIAAYLDRDVTTVQRWEKREGMPVHRHLHDRSGSVYAYSSELDAWRQSRKLRLETEEKDEEAETPKQAPAEARKDKKDHRPKETRWARHLLVLAGMAVLALLALTYVLIRGRTGDATQPKIRSLAVLPLKNLSGDPAQEYLADGLTEALIGRLASIHDLRVISRTSVMHFKDTQLSVPEIAKTLRVDAIVEGSVIREGSRIRVHAQLIRAATDEHDPRVDDVGRELCGRALEAEAHRVDDRDDGVAQRLAHLALLDGHGFRQAVDGVAALHLELPAETGRQG